MKQKDKAKENTEREWQVSLAYKQLFDTPNGQIVLEHLRNKYGWQVTSARQGMSANDIIINEANKACLYEIQWHIDRKKPEALDRPTEALHE